MRRCAAHYRDPPGVHRSADRDARQDLNVRRDVRSVAASGFDTTRPFESVTVGPNRGSAAATLVTMGPLYGPARNTTLLVTRTCHGAW